MVMKNSEINSKIGTKIKLLRMKVSLSQEQLALQAGINKNSLGAIERGQSSPTVETLAKISEALGLELKELVDVSKIDL